MPKFLLGAVLAVAVSLLGVVPAAQARAATSTAAASPHTPVINLRAAYEHALSHVKLGRVTGIVYARGRGGPMAAARTVTPGTATPGTATPGTATPGTATPGTATTCVEPDCPVVDNGGPVEHRPRVYLLLWGPNWQTDSAQQASANYLESFYQGLGVRPQDNWSTITSQYTDATGFPVFNSPVFAGAYVDTSIPPTGVTQAQLTAEADAFATTFNLTTDPVDDQVVIATQSGTCPQGFYSVSCGDTSSTAYCAWHSASPNTNITFTNLPYVLDAGSGCGEKIIPNGTSSVYDGFSINAGHEYAETVTDPYANAWIDNNDAGGGEVGDKCAWVYPGGNVYDIGLVTLSTGAFAMQPLFSNANLAASGQSCPLAASPDTLRVTNPGAESSATGIPVSVQVNAASSAGAQLAYSATGLPAGLSMDPATGLITGTPGTPATSSVTVMVDDTTGAYGSVSFTWTVSTPSAYTPLGPVRVMDTRYGTGVRQGPVGAGQTVSLQVTGKDGVPSSGVSAVVLNVTAVKPTAGSYVTVYPDGTSRPVASNLNFTAGEVIPNLVTVPVGSGGKVDFYNYHGSVNLVADLAGYYTTTGSGSLFDSLGPVRILDTRNGTGGYSSPVGAGQTISLQVEGRAGIPSSGVSAVVLNVTAVKATAGSYVTVYPDGTSRPVASDLNFTAGEVFPNLVVVPVGSDGKVNLYNYHGSVNLVADVSGYYTAAGAAFTSVGPVRVLDTRTGTGGYSTPVGPGQTISLQVAGRDGVPASGVSAVVLNVTAVKPTAGSYVTVYPDGTARPVASNLNFTAGDVFPNLVVVPVGSDGKVDFYNYKGSVNLVADLAGYYIKA